MVFLTYLFLSTEINGATIAKSPFPEEEEVGLQIYDIGGTSLVQSNTVACKSESKSNWSLKSKFLKHFLFSYSYQNIPKRKKLEVHNFWSLFQFPYQNENFIQLFFQRKKLEANIFWSIFHIFINNFRSKFLKEFK